ncbi:hypothetical protein NHF50_12305 [Flavobacterium sp. NRK F10]|uniref:hypothetical protein n=1 Tax=Flavobacterium sp. NRK F10 TaxID=2954931 RepID=UPI002091C90C|nr:hypothetical protein [Flavobacterium sp. NRK F10]MCO6175826.1 hypothetical protein [Flavobacterium sp. NRK F10]
MDKLIELLISSGPPALLILVGLVWGKNLIEYFFKEIIEIKKKELAQNLENHKMKIEQENKNFQHILDAKLHEFNIKFTNLHSERAKVIKELYLKMLILQSSLNDVFKIKPNHINNNIHIINNFSNSFQDFQKYYLPNKIYFSEKLSTKIDIFLEEYSFITTEFTNILLEKNVPIESLKPKWDKLSKDSSDYTFEIINELIKDFRNILGVEN